MFICPIERNGHPGSQPWIWLGIRPIWDHHYILRFYADNIIIKMTIFIKQFNTLKRELGEADRSPHYFIMRIFFMSKHLHLVNCHFVFGQINLGVTDGSGLLLYELGGKWNLFEPLYANFVWFSQSFFVALNFNIFNINCRMRSALHNLYAWI